MCSHCIIFDRTKKRFAVTIGKNFGSKLNIPRLVLHGTLGRYDENGNIVDMPGHSVPMIAIGGFVLLFGFLAFNGGSQVWLHTFGSINVMNMQIHLGYLGCHCEC